MRKYLLALAALIVLGGSAMAAPAFEFRRPSDNTVLGTLDSDGNHTTYGTHTVVGQDGDGYSVRLSSGIDLRDGGCIDFKDGRQCAAFVSTASASDWLLSETYLGVSSVTINLEQFGVQVSSRDWEFYYNCSSTGNATWFNVNFNSDITQGYNYSVGNKGITANVLTANGGANDKAFGLSGTSTSTGGGRVKGHLTFSTCLGQASTCVSFWFSGKASITTAYEREASGGGEYTGASDLSQVQFYASSAGSGSAQDFKYPITCRIAVRSGDSW